MKHMLFENIGAALAGIKANKMRSFLTMLGILIGIAAIIAIIMAGNGMSSYIEDMMNSIGANRIEFYVTQRNWDDTVSQKESDLISQDMIRKVNEEFKNEIQDISLTTALGEGIVKEGKDYAKVNVLGSNSSSMIWDEDEILAGRVILSSEQQNGANVAMVSDKLVNNMFHGNPEEAVGQEIDVQVNNQYYTYTIVGVYQSYTNQQMTGSSYDEVTTLYVPLKVVHRVISNAVYVSWFDINGKEGVDSHDLANRITDYMNENFYSKNANFMIDRYTMQEQAQMANEQIGMIKIVMGGIGAISLLVGGIGVMNIMIKQCLFPHLLNVCANEFLP